jgi:hypothetical protein
MKRLLSAGLVIFIAGCSHSSGVIKIGPETYTISTSASWAKGGAPSAKRIAYDEANEQCIKQGNLEVFLLSEKSNTASIVDGMFRFELNFRCLKASDPEFKRQNLQSAPDSIIENRRR